MTKLAALLSFVTKKQTVETIPFNCVEVSCYIIKSKEMMIFGRLDRVGEVTNPYMFSTKASRTKLKAATSV